MTDLKKLAIHWAITGLSNEMYGSIKKGVLVFIRVIVSNVAISCG